MDEASGYAHNLLFPALNHLRCPVGTGALGCQRTHRRCPLPASQRPGSCVGGAVILAAPSLCTGTLVYASFVRSGSLVTATPQVVLLTNLGVPVTSPLAPLLCPSLRKADGLGVNSQ